MAQEKTELTEVEFDEIVAKHKFNKQLLLKDYLLTRALYLMKDIEDIYFKGGTALNKMFLSHARLSEDIDLTITGQMDKIKAQITKCLSADKRFGKVTTDKDMTEFVRMVVPYTEFGSSGTIFVDLNAKAKLFMKPQEYPIAHYYPNIPKFSFRALDIHELIAEKMRATISRNKPRDHLDLYYIIKAGLPMDMKLVELKCKDADVPYDIEKMFNKAKTLHKRWFDDIEPLLVEQITFEEVMTTLAKHFKLKDVKEAKKIK